MIQLALIIAASIALVAFSIFVTLWYWQREPAGHPQHANPDRERRTVAALWRTFQAGWDAPAPQTVTLTRRDLPCEQPDPRWALENHHTDLPGPAGARRQAASEPAMAVMPAAETDESLYPLEMTRVAVARAGEPQTPGSNVKDEGRALGGLNNAHNLPGRGPEGARDTGQSPAAGELDRGAASPVREAGPESSREKGFPGPVGRASDTGHRLGEPRHRDWTVRPLAPARDGLAPWIAAALANAKADDTVIDRDHTTLPAWLEHVVGGDPWNGKGSKDAYHQWLFAGMAGAR